MCVICLRFVLGVAFENQNRLQEMSVFLVVVVVVVDDDDDDVGVVFFLCLGWVGNDIY